MHIKHTWQEDVMPKEFIQDCIFWHIFTFTCHDTLVYPGHGKSERKPAEGTSNTGPALGPLGTNAKGLNEFNSNRFISFQGFPISTKLEEQPYAITHFPTGHISLSCMSPHTLHTNCITIIQKINPNHF